MSTKTTLQNKIEEYNFSNPSTPLTQENINIALEIKSLQSRREEADHETYNLLTEELYRLMDNNNQARFFAEMIKSI